MTKARYLIVGSRFFGPVQGLTRIVPGELSKAAYVETRLGESSRFAEIPLQMQTKNTANLLQEMSYGIVAWNLCDPYLTEMESAPVLMALPTGATRSLTGKGSLLRLDTAPNSDLVEGWIRRRDIAGFLNLVDSINVALLQIAPDKTSLAKLSSEAYECSELIQEKSPEAAFLRRYFEGLSDFIFGLYEASLGPSGVDSAVELFLRPILLAMLRNAKTFNDLLKEYSGTPKAEFLNTNLDDIIQYLLEEFYRQLLGFPMDLERLSNVAYCWQLVAGIAYKLDETRGNDLLRMHDYITDLLVTSRPARDGQVVQT